MRKKKVIVLGFLICLLQSVWSENNFAWDFSDCEIKDILFAVSLDTGISIVGDDTVYGKGDFKFSGSNFEIAFDSFLKSCRLYSEKTENLWTVSKIHFYQNKDKVCFDAYDVTPAVILEKLSEKLEVVLNFDNLPVQKISVHYKNISVDELFNVLAKRFGNYEVSTNGKNISFVKKIQDKKVDAAGGYIKYFCDENGIISVDIKNALFKDSIEELFYCDAAKNIESPYFCFAFEGDSKIERSIFNCNEFNEVLDKLCGLNEVSYELKDDIYYFFPKKDSKDVLIYGEKNWERFDLQFYDANRFVCDVLKDIEKNNIVVKEGDKFFYAQVTESKKKNIEELINKFDVKTNVHVIELKFIKPDKFFEFLPPEINRTDLVLVNEDTKFYFKGNEKSYKDLCDYLNIIDTPEKTITYDLLIMEYKESEQLNYSTDFGSSMLEIGSRNGVSAILGSVLNLNMNIVSAFGLDFAANLQTAMEKNTTNVFVDTTLQGLSGKNINFQNTNTYRYRDNNLDPETGKPIYSGITKEITSGIKIDLYGWVSGDGLISTKVTASISRQGTDTSSSTGNPPPTSEKIITTEVNGKSGIPIVISGLIENSQTDGIKGVPGIDKIPVLRKIFSANQKNKEKSQMVIYLVPKLEKNPVEIVENKKEKMDLLITKYEKILYLLEEV